MVVGLNLALLVLIIAGGVAEIFFRGEIGENLAEDLLENPNTPDWNELADTFHCCPRKAPVNGTDTTRDLECCAEEVFKKYMIKGLFVIIEIVILLAAVIVAICFCRAAVKAESLEREKRKLERERKHLQEEQEKFKEERKKLHEEVKQDKMKGQQEIELMKKEQKLKEKQAKIRKKEKANKKKEKKRKIDAEKPPFWERFKFWKDNTDDENDKDTP